MVTPTFNWSAPLTAVDITPAALNSTLANAGYALTAAINPSTFTSPNSYGLVMEVEVALASFSPAANGYLTLWRLDSIDGTNFADGDTSNAPQGGTPVWTHGVLNGTSVTRRIIFPGIIIPPGQFKFLLQNNTGASLAATGNTLKYTVYTPQYPSL